MSTRTVRIWLLVYNDRLLKAISCPEDGTLIIYDEYDNVLIKRMGLTPAQIKKIEITIAASGAKQLDGPNEPINYL
ncbi:MAG: hypothetical protein V1726_04800 [Methanobacteriota archaeon]